MSQGADPCADNILSLTAGAQFGQVDLATAEGRAHLRRVAALLNLMACLAEPAGTSEPTSGSNARTLAVLEAAFAGESWPPQ